MSRDTKPAPGSAPDPPSRTDAESKPLSPVRERDAWSPAMIGRASLPAASADRPKSELPDGDRFLSSEMASLGYEMVERGPLARAAAAAKAARAPVQIIEDPDQDLVKRWQAGDESCFEQLIRRHERKVFRLLLRMMGSREEAEDVAQETFLSLHRHGHRFRGEARFSTFVYRVASNAALNRRRTLGRNRARIQKLAVRQAAGDDLPESPRDPESAIGGGEISLAVRQALDSLKPSLRLPVLLYDIEGLAYGEIAEVLGVAEGTVKSRIHRARQALRAQLAPLLAEPNDGSQGPVKGANQ